MDRKSTRMTRRSMKPILPEICNYQFDIAITLIESPTLQPRDIKNLKVETVFNNRNLSITSSRMNVTDFQPGSGLSFSVKPEALRRALEKCGLPLIVYNNGDLMGTGRISFPDIMMEGITSGEPNQQFTDSCDIISEGRVTARMEVIYGLLIKCDEMKSKVRTSECMKSVDQSIKEKDILFILNKEQRILNDCDHCFDAIHPNETEERLNFGLQLYPSFKIPALIHYPAVDEITHELDQMKMECQQTLKYVLGPSQKKERVKPPCREPDTLEKISKSESVENPLPQYTKQLPVPPVPKPTVCSPEWKPGDQPYTKPIRFCPICLNDLSWMPKYASCPKCGAKPELVEVKKEVRIPTADEIIYEYLGTMKKTDDVCEDPCKADKRKKQIEEPGCQCTCKGYKLCSFCRVQKLVADLDLSWKKKTESPIKKEILDGTHSSNDCLAFEKPQLSRPFLVRVFSELRDLYDMKHLHSPSMNDVKEEVHVRPEPITPVIKSQYGRPTERKPRSPKNRKKNISKHHKKCIYNGHHVSGSHGWAWNSTREARKHGWRPGAILRPLKKIMEHFLDHQKNPVQICKEIKKTVDQRMPTLSMSKKNGVIFITLRSINNSNVQMKPIVFRVVKSKLAVALKKIKRTLKDQGFPKCTCHQTVMMCVCRSLPEKRKLEASLKRECNQYGIANCVDHLILTDTSESEPEFDFNLKSPAASAKPCLAVKARTINQTTQTLKKTEIAVPRYPVKLSPYWRAYDCAAGDRYTGTAFGAPGEAVFEDGIFGFGGGGPHGASATPGGRGKPPSVWGAGGGGPMRGALGGRGGPGSGSGPGGAFGGKSFPGNKLGKDEKRAPAPAIPVRMTERYKRQVAEAEQAKKDQIQADLAKKKRGINLIEYLENKGSVPKPWDPNNPKPKNQPPKPKGPEVGPDGLTAAQRKRRDLLMGPCPPLDHMPRLGKCPGNCYNPCHGQVCYNCFYNYYC